MREVMKEKKGREGRKELEGGDGRIIMSNKVDQDSVSSWLLPKTLIFLWISFFFLFFFVKLRL